MRSSTPPAWQNNRKTIALLSDAMDAVHALLQAHGVPGQVEVDHGIGELQIAARLGAGRQEHVGSSRKRAMVAPFCSKDRCQKRIADIAPAADLQQARYREA